eukprot:scaffold41518_cov33-Prasinocladus_malaysianus.AAC.2
MGEQRPAGLTFVDSNHKNDKSAGLCLVSVGWPKNRNAREGDKPAEVSSPRATGNSAAAGSDSEAPTTLRTCRRQPRRLNSVNKYFLTDGTKYTHSGMRWLAASKIQYIDKMGTKFGANP